MSGFSSAWSAFEQALGLGLQSSQLHFGHMALRCVVVFFTSILMTRIGDKRFLGQNAALDVMLVVILGSVVSRGIDGQAPFFSTLGAGFVLVLLHRLLATAAYRSHWVSTFAKGRDRVLVRHGRIVHEEMKRNAITPDDLLEGLRAGGNTDDVSKVQEARLERNGRISVIKKSG